uniref:Uncharacterized protein n=1 Tax=Sphaerodactylus townsendi TaxID=933632 RepID=A0ACB8F789_9SAUR
MGVNQGTGDALRILSGLHPSVSMTISGASMPAGAVLLRCPRFVGPNPETECRVVPEAALKRHSSAVPSFIWVETSLVLSAIFESRSTLETLRGLSFQESSPLRAISIGSPSLALATRLWTGQGVGGSMGAPGLFSLASGT